jgi:hypothetical protein
MNNLQLARFLLISFHRNLKGILVGRVERISSAVQSHDWKLYCAKDIAGKLCIFRKSQRVETFYLDDTTVIHSVRPAPHFVMALTHNWKANGIPVDWGLEPILARVKSLDLWNRDIVSDLEVQEEKHLESCERDRKNKTEDFLHEFRSDFKRTFSDVNTSTLDKKKQIKHINKE